METTTHVETKNGYVMLQVIRVYKIPVEGTDEDDCVSNAYKLTTEQIKEIGTLVNVELDYAEFQHWEGN